MNWLLPEHLADARNTRRGVLWLDVLDEFIMADPRRFEFFHTRTRTRYPDFRQDYLEELADNPEWPPFVEHLQELLQKGDVLFLYGAKDEEHNQAVVLKEAAEEALAKLP